MTRLTLEQLTLAIKNIAQITEANLADFLENAQVSHAFNQGLDAFASMFTVHYICPKTGVELKFTDNVLWNDDLAILEQGIQAEEIRTYKNHVEFNLDTTFKTPEGKFQSPKGDQPISDYIFNIGLALNEWFNPDDHFPGWQQSVVDHIKDHQ